MRESVAPTAFRKPFAGALSLIIAASPASAIGQRAVSSSGSRIHAPIATAIPGAALPAIPALGSLPGVVVPADAGRLPSALPAEPSANLSSPEPQEPAAPRSAEPSPLAQVEAAAEQARRDERSAPAVLSNLFGERVGSTGSAADAVIAARAEERPVSRLARWSRGPAVKTAASLVAAASPFLILAAKTRQGAASVLSAMDLDGAMTTVAPVVDAAAVNAAAAVGAVFGLAVGAVLGRALSVRLEKKAVARGAAVMVVAVVTAATAGLGASVLAGLSPALAAVTLSGTVIALAAQADLIAPFTRRREARARRVGLFDVVDKDGKMFLDLKRLQLGRLHMLSGTVERGLGEKNLATNTQWDFEFAFYFRRVGDRIELVRKNTFFRAPEGSALHKTISRGVPDSVVASAPLVEIDGRLRVDAAKLFVADFFGLGSEVDWGYGFDYSMDADLSRLEDARVFPSNVEIQSRLTFLRGESDDTRTHLSDTRRVDLHVRYSLSALPEPGYRPRKATPLIGHFVTAFEDWSDDQKPSLDAYLVNRWRLEKSDPAQAVSQVKKPIVYWIDDTIPKEYRAAVARGVLKWNQAFERIGLLGALEVREAPEDGSFDPTDIRRNMISYRFERDSPYALGNSRANPLTGEIYHAHVTIVPEHVRNALELNFRDIGDWTERELDRAKGSKAARGVKRKCGHGEAVARDASLALAVLESRGALNAQSRAKVLEDYMEELVLHEIGHTLGLRHNFIAKNWLSLAQTSETGVFSASVMDYAPLNLASSDEKQGALFQTQLGPYDFHAIEYAYKPFEPQDEDAELAKIVARSAQPELDYLTDEDLVGLDPRVEHSSLGTDLVAYAARRTAITRELWAKLEADVLEASSDHQLAYRKWLQGWLGFNLGARQAARLVGGLYFHRTAGETPRGRTSYEAVPAADQRRALQFIADTVLSDEAFSISPELLRAVAQRRDGGPLDGGYGSDLTYFSHGEMVMRLRDNVLELLLDQTRLERLAESAKLVTLGEDRMTIREVYDSLVEAAFLELKTGARRRKKGTRSISPMRRQLQDKLMDELLSFINEEGGWSVELRLPARATLIALQRRVGTALKSSAWDEDSRAHLTELSRLLKKGLTPNKD